ncbi:hypothetical protein CRG98_005910 [Punica granatum]|uniref:Uncharacterized protein n=1 Tax=Punica granatum TaxID=22663 RepID=A0A2I0KYX5_PUNGR|nr:hypothetical protein CRG98_005910 [Punica granatum]
MGGRLQLVWMSVGPTRFGRRLREVWVLIGRVFEPRGSNECRIDNAPKNAYATRGLGVGFAQFG